jgi:hypothetical protein
LRSHRDWRSAASGSACVTWPSLSRAGPSARVDHAEALNPRKSNRIKPQAGAQDFLMVLAQRRRRPTDRRGRTIEPIGWPRPEIAPEEWTLEPLPEPRFVQLQVAHQGVRTETDRPPCRQPASSRAKSFSARSRFSGSGSRWMIRRIASLAPRSPASAISNAIASRRS